MAGAATLTMVASSRSMNAATSTTTTAMVPARPDTVPAAWGGCGGVAEESATAAGEVVMTATLPPVPDAECPRMKRVRDICVRAVS